jgi:hypothetical protein
MAIQHPTNLWRCAAACFLVTWAPGFGQEPATSGTAAPAAAVSGTGAAADSLASEAVSAAGAAAMVAPEPSEAPAPAGTEALMGGAGGASPSMNVTINLIRRLVQKGVLSQEDANELIQQAEADAAQARAMAQADAVAAAEAVVAQNAADPAEPGDLRVQYVPEVVKSQMRDEIKAEVLAQARTEGWATRHTVPEWVSRVRLFGDVRTRYEGLFYSDGNDNTGAFPNFNSINTGAPFDVSGTEFSPQLNVDQDRNRIRLRARIGAEIGLADGFTTGLRLATGDTGSPVSPNQTFGQSGGNFSKYAIWLDRAFLKYELGDASRGFAISVGRFDNPFFATDILYDDDLGFDGFSAQARYEVGAGIKPFIAGGAFPIYNTDLNFASNQPAKFDSADRWLYGGQLGVDWKITPDLSLKVAVAYYLFDEIQGELSDPYVPLDSNDQGNTDNRRPTFAQKGNTYMALRNIVSSPLNDFGTRNQYQYFGLASEFEELAVTGQLSYDGFEPVRITVGGEWVRNLAHNSSDIDKIAVNNRGPDTSSGEVGPYAGGDTAWIVGLKVGTPAMQRRWDWQVGVNYRHVESDAVVDGFTDSDFAGGGSNVEGYSVYGALALSPNVSVGLRWMSGENIDGPPLKIDTLQIDLNGKF